MYTATLQQIADQFHLVNLTEGIDLTKRKITTAEINRPALQLTGFYDYFDHERVQLIGMVESAYLNSVSKDMRCRIYERLFATKIPCLIFCRGLTSCKEDNIPQMAEKYGIPLLVTNDPTTTFTSRLIRYLSYELAPRMSLHGVMVDVFGEGVLILGESGLGKSETALELVQRGHRLVADDIVEIRRISDNELMAQGAEMIQNLVELRGIGVINIKEMYGVQAVRMNKSIDMVIKLEPWKPDVVYDRIGLEQETTDILGNAVACYTIPIMVGRNLAMVIEAAALNHRVKKMGYNAAEELKRRVNENVEKRLKERAENEEKEQE